MESVPSSWRRRWWPLPLRSITLACPPSSKRDRFHAFSSELKRGNRRICLLAVCAGQKPEGMEALKIHFERIASYLGWEDGGSVLALGCFDRADLEKTDYPRQAWELGRGLLRGDRG